MSLYCEIAGNHLQEAWGDYVDTSEWMRDTAMFNLAGNPYGPMPSNSSDRLDGQYWPFYRTEWDVARIRGECRQIAKLSSIAVGAVEALERYIIGKGFQIAAEPRENVAVDPTNSAALIEEINTVIEEFTEQNKWSTGSTPMDCEMHTRLREDGQLLIELESRLQNGGYGARLSSIGVKARFVEPDNLTEPADSYSMDRWLGIADRMPCSWSFGILTPERDTDEALGFHVIYGNDSYNWAFLPNTVGHPANPRQSAVFAKRNVPRNCKLGLPDFMPIVGDLSREGKLSNNMAVGAAIQAAIAFVEQRPANAALPSSAGAAYSPQTTAAIGSVPFPNLNGGYKQINVNNFPAGSIVKTTMGFEHKPGPMGAERNSGFLTVAQYLLRRIGVRWNAPEYIISGDSSNANYASSLVAESPFVKARESDQKMLAGITEETLWKVIQFYCLAGRFSRYVRNFADLKRQVMITIVPPEVATRDPLVLSQTLSIQQDKGWISTKTAQQKLGLDPETETVNGAKPADGSQPQGGSPTGTPGATPDSTDPTAEPQSQPSAGAFTGLNRRDFTNNAKQVKDVLDGFINGNSEVLTRISLQRLGLTEQQIETLIEDAKDGRIDDPSLQESLRLLECGGEGGTPGPCKGPGGVDVSFTANHPQHNIPLARDKANIPVDQAVKALGKSGFYIGDSQLDSKGNQIRYVQNKDNEVLKMSDAQIVDLAHSKAKKLTGPEPAPAAPKKPEVTAEHVTGAMKSLEPGAERGALVGIKDLRQHFGDMSKADFDAAILNASKQGHISLHHTDYASGMQPHDRDQLVSYPVDPKYADLHGSNTYQGRAYVIGAAIRRNKESELQDAGNLIPTTSIQRTSAIDIIRSWENYP